MARSSYIYLVCEISGVGQFQRPARAFTVKHELISWLTLQRTENLVVYRMRDGGFIDTLPKEIPITTVLAGQRERSE
jgi:hypothetical protein